MLLSSSMVMFFAKVYQHWPHNTCSTLQGLIQEWDLLGLHDSARRAKATKRRVMMTLQTISSQGWSCQNSPSCNLCTCKVEASKGKNGRARDLHSFWASDLSARWCRVTGLGIQHQKIETIFCVPMPCGAGEWCMEISPILFVWLGTPQTKLDILCVLCAMLY